jgi:hypothetical protein
MVSRLNRQVSKAEGGDVVIVPNFDVPGFPNPHLELISDPNLGVLDWV